MTERAVLTQLATAQAEIEHLKRMQAENKADIDELKKRLSAYDLLAAKWGGICMLAVGLGAWLVSNGDKIKAYLVGKS